MSEATLAVAILGLLLSLNKYRSWHNPYTVFNILWIAVDLMIIIGDENIFEPNQTAKLCVLIGVIAFNLSTIMPRIVIGNNHNQSDAINYELNDYRAYWLSVLILVLSVISAASAINSLFAGNSFATIREDYYTVSSGESVYMYYFRNYFISPMRYVVIISTIIAFFKKTEQRNRLLVNTVIIIALQAISSGGRYVLMNSFFMLLCGLLIFGRELTITRKQKAVFVVICIVLMYGIIYLTNDRTTHQTADMTTLQRLGSTIYSYFAGSVTYLGKVIEKNPDIVGSTYGLNGIAGFLTPIFAALTFLHLLSYPQVFNVIGTYACEVLKIGDGMYYNAMPTIFGYFYIDGGIIFVFLETFIFGYVCKRLYERSSGGNLLYTAFYILIFVQICNASTRWFVYSSDYCLAFLYMPFVMSKIFEGGVLLWIILYALKEFLQLHWRDIYREIDKRHWCLFLRSRLSVFPPSHYWIGGAV